LAGENFGELQAKLHLAKKTLANLTPNSMAFSDITSNWRIKLWRIRNKSPNSPKFSPAKIFRCTVYYSSQVKATVLLPSVEAIFVTEFWKINHLGAFDT